MARLTIQLPENLISELYKQAERCNKGIEELIIEKLEEGISEDRMERFIRESGLFVSQEDKLGPELKSMIAHPISSKRRAQLARKASIGKPLSQIIIEDRR